MVFHGRFGRVLNLLQIHLEQLGQRGCRHAAGAANFGLATTLRAANGGVCLDDVADNPARCERVEHFRVGEPVLFLHIPQYSRHDAARTAGGRSYDDAAAALCSLTA